MKRFDQVGKIYLFWIQFGNSGNVDLLEEQIIVISWPTNADLEIINAISAYGQPLPQPVIDGDKQGIGVFIPRLQANESSLIPFVLSTSSIGANLTLSAAAVSASSFPYTSPSMSSQFNLGTTTAFSNSPSGEGALPDGAIVFMGPHDSNPFGHEAIVENIGGEAYVWDHWLATVAENIEQPIPLSRPGPNNDWQDIVGGSYLGGAVSSSWTEGNRKDAVEAAKEIIQNKKNIDWVFDWGAKSDEAGYTCTSFIEHVYELAGVDIITSSNVDPLFLFPSVHHRFLTGELDFYAANTYSQSYLIAWPITPMEHLVHAGLLNVLQSAVFGTFIEVQVVGSIDPNEKLGPIGTGDARFIQNDQEMTYVIKFENIESATAPAQEVVITDQLDTSVIDISTLKLLDVSFGSKTVTPSEATADLFAVVDLRPEQELIVNIETTLNTETGLLTWYFTSIDPATGELPTDALAGFLPPNTNPPEGEGFVMFTVQLTPDLPLGTKIENEATIIFDTNEPIQTNTWVNTIPIYTYLPTVLR